MKKLLMIAVCLFVSYSASAQTYYNSSYTGAEVDAALLKARDSMLVAADTTTKVAMQWELNGKLDDADSTAQTVWTDLKLALKAPLASPTFTGVVTAPNFTGALNASDGNPDSALYIDADGNTSIGTTDLDGTPAIGRLTIKGSTNDGSTNILVGRDSDEANVFVINTDGKIGVNGRAINTSYGISVNNGITMAGGSSLDWDGGNARINESSYKLSFQTYTGSALTTKMIIQGDGNIGIGATTPYNKLSVISSNATNVNAFNFVDTDVNTNITTAATARDTSSINGWFSGSGSPSFTVIGKAGETLFKVDSSGIAAGDNDIFDVDSLEVTGTASVDTMKITKILFSTPQYGYGIDFYEGGAGVQQRNIMMSDGGVIGWGGSTDYGLYKEYGTTNMALSTYGNLNFRTYDGAGYNTAMVITGNGATGNVGVGTTSPDIKLAVNGAYNYYADTSVTVDSIRIATDDISSLVTGQQLFVNVLTAIDGAATLKIGNLLAKAIKKKHDQDVISGDIEAGQIIHVIYDGTNWQLLSQLAQ